jgi:hypothetical protein
VSRATCNDDVFAYLEDSTGHVLVVKSSKEIERMFLKKKPDPNPRGVPLDDLQRLLSTTTLKISRDAESLIAEHATAVTKLKVIPPAPEEESEDPIQAVVQITTDWPGRFPRLPLLTPESLVFLNRANFSLPKSRLTAFESERAWNLYLPFLMFAVISGSYEHDNIEAKVIVITGATESGENRR